MDKRSLTVSTPGRICLFGEHQDYLGLPVIAAGISRRVRLTGTRRKDSWIRFSLPDIQQTLAFDCCFPITYTNKRDYYRSALNILYRRGYRYRSGFDITVQGDIPINSGTSSSSALLVTWIHFLAEMADEKPGGALSLSDIAELTFEAEVLEFQEPGGRMDQYATSLGNVLLLESEPMVRHQAFMPRLGAFVLGDSGEPKDTIGILKRVKWGMLEVEATLKKYDPSFSLDLIPLSELPVYKHRLTPEQWLLLEGNIRDRDILREAKAMLLSDRIDDHRLGLLLSLHQRNLRDAKQISTPKINRMIDASLNAGAVGAKINGSGGGGCMFAYAPDCAVEVAAAIEREGGVAHIIHVDEGTRIDS